MPTCCNAWPTARKPSGPISDDTVITAVITFGRRAWGVRTVKIVSTGALTRGAHDPKTANTIKSAGHGIEIATNQSGSDMSRIAAPASFRSGTLRTSRAATRLPKSAPAPNAAKQNPTIFGSAS